MQKTIGLIDIGDELIRQDIDIGSILKALAIQLKLINNAERGINIKQLFGGHLYRTACVSTIIANELAEEGVMNATEVVLMYVASYIHDIGKISVPPSILNKTSKLTTREYNIVKKHVTRVGNLLDNMDREIKQTKEYKFIRNVIELHHVHWKGDNGYPNTSLEGDKLPLESRICSIADAYDSLTSYRPYRLPVRHEIAVEEICNNSGGQFCPYLVKVFTQCEQKIKSRACNDYNGDYYLGLGKLLIMKGRGKYEYQKILEDNGKSYREEVDGI
jgi:HD-GYP domain-containing protein (c-di-GMP phosphodiesterase class II)